MSILPRRLLTAFSQTRPLVSLAHSPQRSLMTSSSSAAWLEQIPIDLPHGISRHQLQSFRPFNNWALTLHKSLGLQTNSSHPFHAEPYALRSITIQSYDRFGGDRLGFVKLTASVSNAAGESLPAATLLRGPSVGMLVMLIPDDAPSGSDERYVVLTVQPRIPAASLSFAELPAGMFDPSGLVVGLGVDKTGERGQARRAGTRRTSGPWERTFASEEAMAGDGRGWERRVKEDEVARGCEGFGVD
ncbi:NUDIX family hydrolase [Ophiocordyceps sinensis CO18]|uniref:NUDIX family hydrolase n=1 Tax=Ophiocordyceps sinensis (strain Co18 / CGMCC 3.14243) TaxID=911162 RepID=T5A4M8_OPHSC|nr:NUDIX family hydrolase [Ophiocordyceps sinensis CO18]